MYLQHIMFCTVTKGKKHTITTYLDEIDNSVKNIDDEGVLDHTIAKLLPIVTSLRAHLTQSIDDEDDVDIQDFEVTEKFAPAQKNEVQLSFRKVNTPGRKKTKLPFKYDYYRGYSVCGYPLSLYGIFFF